MKVVSEKETRIKLMRELKRIYDDKDFVVGVATISGYDSVRKEILDYIHSVEEDGGIASPDDITALALSLRKEIENDENGSKSKRKMVAML